MIIDCISDLHGEYPPLNGGDLLIVAGDLTGSDKDVQYFDFEDWLKSQNYKKKIVIGGNHDNFLVKNGPYMFEGADYLCDSGTEFDGLKIWGSPWSLSFPGINPHCKAFTGSENELAAKFMKIPEDTDILITHSPPFGILDAVEYYAHPKAHKGYLETGSVTLRNIVLSKERMPNLKLHVFGHIHEWGGKMIDFASAKFVNASIMNRNYLMVNEPVRVIL